MNNSKRFFAGGVALKSVVNGDNGGSCYPIGQCTKTTIANGYSLYDKVYTIEDSIILRALAVFGSKMLDGGYITIIPNVKDKVPLYRDEMDFKYQSAANGGRGATECGPFMPKGKIDIITDKCLSVNYMYIEAAICYKKLIGSFRQSLLRPGTMFSDENTALNDRVLDGFVKSSNKQTDMLIWHGDYKSPIDDICHYDGLIKKIALSTTGQPAHSFEIKMTNAVESDDVIEGKVGGQEFMIPFDTDANTTFTSLAAHLATLTHPLTASPLFTTMFDGTDTIKVVSNYHNIEIEMMAVVTDGTGINRAGCANVAGKGEVVVNELVAFKAQDIPITVPYKPVTAANVISIFNEMYLKTAAENGGLLGESDFYFHVSPHVYACLVSAQTMLTGPIVNINQRVTPAPFGMRLIEQPSMQYHIIVGTRTSNIFFGTDLMTDMGNTEQWVDKNCQEVRFRHEMMQGVQIDRYSETVSNLECTPFTFQDAQPDNCGSVVKPCA